MGLDRVPLFVSRLNGLQVQQTFKLELFEPQYLRMAELLSSSCPSFGFVPSTQKGVNGFMCEALKLEQLPNGSIQLEAKVDDHLLLQECVQDSKTSLMFAKMTGTTAQVRSTVMIPKHLIRNAIQDGAPMYNAGHIADCADLYQSVLVHLCGVYQGRALQFVEGTLQKAKEATSDDKRAWLLREALDALLAADDSQSHDNSPGSSSSAVRGRSSAGGGGNAGKGKGSTGGGNVPGGEGSLLPFKVGAKILLAERVERFATINDTVMGGSSSSSIQNMGTYASFSGELVIRNGGFASVAARTSGGWDIGAGGARSAVLCVRGDGRRYKLSLRNEQGPQAVTYQQSFDSSSEWTETVLDFNAFTASWRGRRVPDAAPLDLSNDGSASPGPFRLDIKWVSTR
jgi:hypothetical protein